MSRDDAIMALEKELRKKALAAVNLRDGSGMQDAYNDADDSVSALLSDRQEVAPVAFDTWFREAFPITDLEANDGDTKCMGIRSCSRSAWCAGISYADSTGQASEARDAETEKFRRAVVWDALQTVKTGIEAGHISARPTIVKVHGDWVEESVLDVVTRAIAAMRQEAE